MDSAGMNSVSQNLFAGYKSSPLLITVRFPVAEPYRFSCNLHDVRSEQGLLQNGPSGGKGGMIDLPWVLFYHWKNQRFRGDLSSYPSNAVFVGLYSGREWFALTSVF